MLLPHLGAMQLKFVPRTSDFYNAMVKTCHSTAEAL